MGGVRVPQCLKVHTSTNDRLLRQRLNPSPRFDAGATVDYSISTPILDVMYRRSGLEPRPPVFQSPYGLYLMTSKLGSIPRFVRPAGSIRNFA